MARTRESVPESEERARRYRAWDKYDESTQSFNLASAFKDLIQRDPLVCDNCFLKKYTRVTAEWWRGSLGWLDYERWVPYPDRVEPIPNDTGTGIRLACGSCGHRKTKNRPIPKHRIHDYAKNISETLDMKQVEHDRRVLIREVDRRNNSHNQGRQDSHVFAPAVKLAIEQKEL